MSVRHQDDADVESARRDHVGGLFGMQYLVVDPRRLSRDAATDAETLRAELDLSDGWDEDADAAPHTLEREQAKADEPLEFEHGAHQLPLDHPEVRFGWRGRAIGLALLGPPRSRGGRSVTARARRS